MSTSTQRRIKRLEQREKQKLVKKIHTEFLVRTKGKSDAEVQQILNHMGLKYGMKDPQSGSAE